jgi:hypothetical protein
MARGLLRSTCRKAAQSGPDPGAALSAVTYAVMPGVLAERYYGGWSAMGAALRLPRLP